MNKILIVDDDEELRTNISEILKIRGYSTAIASSGEDAIEKVTSTKFDIAIIDFMMPKMSGMDVLTEFQKITPKTKVIMITAFATIDNAVEAIKRGASDYLSKPFRIEDLDAIIKRTLEEAKFDVSERQVGLDYALGSLSNPLRRDIIRLLDRNKDMRLMEIVRSLNVDDHTKVNFHLRILKDNEIIKQRKKKYFLTKEGKNILSVLNILESHLSI